MALHLLAQEGASLCEWQLWSNVWWEFQFLLKIYQEICWRQTHKYKTINKGHACMKDCKIQVVNCKYFNQAIIDALFSILYAPGSSAASIGGDVQKHDAVEAENNDKNWTLKLWRQLTKGNIRSLWDCLYLDIRFMLGIHGKVKSWRNHRGSIVVGVTLSYPDNLKSFKKMADCRLFVTLVDTMLCGYGLLEFQQPDCVCSWG